MNDLQLRDSSVKNALSHKRNYAITHRAFTDASVLKTKTSDCSLAVELVGRNSLRSMLIRSPSKFLLLAVLL